MKRHLVLAAALAALLSPALSRATITFSAYRDGYWRIYVQDGPGSTPSPVGSAGEDGSAPALSPDGRQVAFEIAAEEIEVCPRDGAGECRAVRGEGGWSSRPAWHPLTGELLFVRHFADARGEDSDIFTTQGGLATSRPLLLQTGNQDFPKVHPGGRLLLYSSAQTIGLHGGGVQVVQQLWVLDLETGRARPLAPGDGQDIHPAWSPSGGRIAFASDRSGSFEIWVMAEDGSGLRKLTSGSGAKTWPAWSPDGREILYGVSDGGRQTLWIMGSDGSGPRPYEPFGPGSAVDLRDPDWR